MRSSAQLGVVAVLLLQSLRAFADDAITNVMSPVVSYQFQNTLNEPGTALSSRIISYQYLDWPGDDVLQLQSSLWVSYYYQFLDVPPLTILPTFRVPTTAESTPAVLLPPPSSSQLKTFAGGVFTTTPASPPDPAKMTIVMTHGWNSRPDEWAKNLATHILSELGAGSANILAWDWENEAQSDCSWDSWGGVGKIAERTPDQGRALGQALQTKLGTGYSQPIHFIGHSLGTLVNAWAADYLHGDKRAKEPVASTPWLPSNTHMTLFDEAEAATGEGCFEMNFIDALRVFFGVGDPLAPKPSYYHRPLPKRQAWADNYIAAFAALHPEAANVILTSGLPSDAANRSGILAAFTSFHGYPYRWYDNSVTDPAGDSALMGFRWSFENNSLASAPAAKSVFLQASGGSELDLVSITYSQGRNLLDERLEKYKSLLRSRVGQIVDDTMTAHGRVSGEMLRTGPPPGMEGSMINWFINLFTAGASGGGQLRPLGGPQPRDGGGGGGETNVPAYAWIPLFVPTNAASMSFDFKIHGDWKDDSLAAAFNGTNVLFWPGSMLETNLLMSSGMIDVTAFAGRTNEFFVGIVGGTSTNAQLTVQDVQFFNLTPPPLDVKAGDGNVLLSWPLAAHDFSLQSTTNLADTSAWTTLTNAPAIVDLQNAVTNPVEGGAKFYRLKK